MKKLNSECKINLQEKILKLFITKNASLQKDLVVIEEITKSANNLKELFYELNNEVFKKVQEQTIVLIECVKIALENYPDLKASNLVQSFIKKIAKQQENVAAGITILNKNVEAFNTRIQTFPGYIL